MLYRAGYISFVLLHAVAARWKKTISLMMILVGDGAWCNLSTIHYLGRRYQDQHFV